MAETQNFKGKYIPALRNAEAVQPTTEVETGITYAVGYVEYLGVLKYGAATLRVWSPFLDEDFWKEIDPGTIIVLDADNAPIEGACKLAGIKNAGIKFYLDLSLVTRPTGDRITIQCTPNNSWPILDKRWSPSGGGAAFPFPANWTTG